MSRIVSFYRGEQPDFLGRKLQEIWQWDNDRLEEIHNYIQVLFPNREPSQVNASAPLLDAAAIHAFRQDEQLRKNLAISFERMLHFFGAKYDPQTGKVTKGPDFAERARNWLSPYNHNYLRITRILKCLVALGLPDHARAFFEFLQEVYSEHKTDIGSESLGYWRNAVTPHSSSEGRTA
jgi:hypothetical protein